jgi:hypothetical protein
MLSKKDYGKLNLRNKALYEIQLEKMPDFEDDIDKKFIAHIERFERADMTDNEYETDRREKIKTGKIQVLCGGWDSLINIKLIEKDYKLNYEDLLK